MTVRMQLKLPGGLARVTIPERDTEVCAAGTGSCRRRAAWPFYSCGAELQLRGGASRAAGVAVPEVPPPSWSSAPQRGSVTIKVSMHQKLNERVVDLDPQETSEWVEALDEVIDEAGPDRAAYLL